MIDEDKLKESQKKLEGLIQEVDRYHSLVSKPDSKKKIIQILRASRKWYNWPGDLMSRYQYTAWWVEKDLPKNLDILSQRLSKVLGNLYGLKKGTISSEEVEKSIREVLVFRFGALGGSGIMWDLIKEEKWFEPLKTRKISPEDKKKIDRPLLDALKKVTNITGRVNAVLGYLSGALGLRRGASEDRVASLYLKRASADRVAARYLKIAAFRRGPLYRRLSAIKPLLARAAQRVYNNWLPDEDGMDDSYGGGGICDDVSNAMADVVYSYLKIEAEIEEGGHPGDDHSWLIVSKGDEAYGLDIPPGVYETGGGYSWQKIPRVRISPHHIRIWWIDPKDLRGW